MQGTAAWVMGFGRHQEGQSDGEKAAEAVAAKVAVAHNCSARTA